MVVLAGASAALWPKPVPAFTLRRHDGAWTASLGLRFVPNLPSVAKYVYDLADGAFAQFADETLRRYNSHLVSRDLGHAVPGDLLFLRQSERKMPFHAMIFLGRSQVERRQEDFFLYHTGPGGEIRQPQWRPVPGLPGGLLAQCLDFPPRIVRELIAYREAHARVPCALKGVESLDRRPLARRSRRATAKHVRILQLLEEFDRIVHAIYAEIEIHDVRGAQFDAGLLAWRECFSAASA
ncbi:MAG: DUF1175 family protein [Bryobacteraceae bacterium]